MFFFFLNDTATTEIYTLSLHDALPIYPTGALSAFGKIVEVRRGKTLSEAPTRTLPACRLLQVPSTVRRPHGRKRSEEHTSELQSRQYLVCRLLLEKKDKYFARRPTVQQ